MTTLNVAIVLLSFFFEILHLFPLGSRSAGALGIVSAHADAPFLALHIGVLLGEIDGPGR